MTIVTDRKRATGYGSAKTGTDQHYAVQVTSAALAVLIPLFVFTFGFALGRPYEEVLVYYSRPFPAIVAGLAIVVSLVHFRQGFQVMMEDYARGEVRHWGIIAATLLLYAAAAAALFALVRLALMTPAALPEAVIIPAG